MRDRLRDEWHRLRGITTKRFSADEVEKDAHWVVGELRRLVEQGAAAASTPAPTEVLSQTE